VNKKVLQNLVLCLVMFFVSTAFGQQASELENPPVGYPGKLEEVSLPGSLLQSKNIETRDQALIVRVTDSFEIADGFRYNFQYHGLEPGDYNLTEYLERADGSDVGELPEVKVTIVPILPPGQIEPNKLVYESSFFRDYYLPILVAVGALWLAGLWLILFWGRGKYRRPNADRHQVTVAQRIRPLIEKAVEGELESAERGELERTLVAFWQKKLRLENAPPAEMMARLRKHPKAGELFRELENWLHRPEPVGETDIAQLMKPYQTMNMDEIE
jgi:hypothetical protein